jgi:hypothetical protein
MQLSVVSPAVDIVEFVAFGPVFLWPFVVSPVVASKHSIIKITFN